MSLSPHPIETALKTLAAKAENSIEQTTTLEDLEQLSSRMPKLRRN